MYLSKNVQLRRRPTPNSPPWEWIRPAVAAIGVATWVLTSPLGLLFVPGQLAFSLWLLGPAVGGVLIGLAAAGRPWACWAAVGLLGLDWIGFTTVIHEEGKVTVGGEVLVNCDWLVLSGGSALAVALLVKRRWQRGDV